jgi:uncharacterized protein
MRFNKCLLLLLAVGSITIAQSQAVKKPVTKKPVQPKNAVSGKLSKTLLWEITGNDLRQPSYLFGTMHVLCAEDAKLSDNLKSIIKKSEKVYFEIDMDDMAQMMGALKYLRMNDGIKISDLLTKEEYAKLEAHFKKSKSPMPLSMLNRFKPYFISGLLSEQTMNCQKKNGMEELIMKEAGTHDRPIFGLESVEFQASLFDSIPYEKQAKDLVQYIDSIDNYKQSTLELVDVYRKQDLDKMDTLMRKSDPGMNQYMDLLLYGRNRKWVQQMPTIMREATMLFAVGAGHLPGEEGVINLLRKKGYTVKPLVN